LFICEVTNSQTERQTYIRSENILSLPEVTKSIADAEKPAQRDGSVIYDFLLTLYSNTKPISYLFRNKRRFRHFPTPVHLTHAPAEGVPLGIWYRHKGSEN